jgi:hypothetical protein
MGDSRLSGRGPKLIAILLVAVVVVAGAGYWLLTRKIPNETTSIAQQTSLLTPIERRSTSTEWTVLGSPTTGSLGTTQTLWLNVSATQPVSYYLGLLESNKTQPYVELAKELRKLPDLTNATAVAKIAYLALNATNPEVREAFELMIDGGEPDQGDFRYPVPRYNTGLCVLYWLASAIDFKRDDTTALAIAMVNGIWVTVGDNEVRSAVSEDCIELLRYSRETDAILRGEGFWTPEDYPLEAKVALAWTGSLTPVFGPFNLDKYYKMERLSLRGYLWNTVSMGTLREMRSMLSTVGAMLSGKSMLETDAVTTVRNLEYYFYFMNPRGASSEHWDYADPAWDDTARKINLDGLTIDNYLIFNVDAMFREQYLKTGKLTGGCMDETVWIDSWAKSIGIATTGLWHWGWHEDYSRLRYNHIFNIYYNPSTGKWTADEQQLRVGLGTGERYQLTQILKPPVDQDQYLAVRLYEGHFVTGDFFFAIYNMTEEDISNMFSPGVASSTARGWLLHSTSTTSVTPATIREGKWNNLTDGSHDVLSESGAVMGDLGQPYVDIASVQYSCSRGSLYAHFDLNGRIPRSGNGTVTAIWYQVLIDVDSKYATGVVWDDYFTPDYMLEYYIKFDATTGTTKAYPIVLKYSGNGTDWTKWAEIQSNAVVEGGLGSDYLTIGCGYGDVDISKGSHVTLLFRSGIVYKGIVYNDPVPDNGPIMVVLPE